MSNEKFSVLMSVYFKEKPNYFKECLESILNQTIVPSEIVLVKDGKLTKELECVIGEYVSKYDNLFKIIELEENKGLGIALQIGLLNCKYDIIARMDTDDICLPDRFEKQLKILKERKDVSVVGSWIGEFEDHYKNINTLRKTPLTFDEIYSLAKKKNPLNHVTVMFRKKDIEQVGNYQPCLWNEDYYLWVRLLNEGYKIINIPEVLVYVRADDSMFERRGGWKYVKAEYNFQKKMLELGFINRITFLKNVCIRSIIRLIPNKLRKQIYKNFLREKVSNVEE